MSTAEALKKQSNANRVTLYYKIDPERNKQKEITNLDRNVVMFLGKRAGQLDGKNKSSMDATILAGLGGPYDKEIKEGYMNTYNIVRKIVDRGAGRHKTKNKNRTHRKRTRKQKKYPM
jgi:hypothetical protein